MAAGLQEARHIAPRKAGEDGAVGEHEDVLRLAAEVCAVSELSSREARDGRATRPEVGLNPRDHLSVQAREVVVQNGDAELCRACCGKQQ
jgi:hypothetical protein